MTLLVLKNVSKTYYRGGRHRLRILHDVSLRVGSGELVAVVADPTAGKTTLLRIAAGLEPPDAGSVLLAGEPLPAANDVDPRIALVTRTPPPRETAGFPMTDFVALALMDRVSPREARQRTTATLDAFELGALADSTWPELSNVERTLIRIAQAIVRRPTLLLLDDPVLGLGISHAETVLSQIRDATGTHGTAALMTVGHPSEALHANRVYTLNAGALMETSRKQDRGQLLDFPAGRVS
ncbi:MAG: ATP-binding cassette domain-containing protein [Conexibacter sp.]